MCHLSDLKGMGVKGLITTHSPQENLEVYYILTSHPFPSVKFIPGVKTSSYFSQ